MWCTMSRIMCSSLCSSMLCPTTTTTTTMSTSMCYYLCAYLPTILLPSKEKVINNQISSHFSIFVYVPLVILFSFLVAGTDKEDQSSEKYHHWKDIRLNFLIFRFNLSVKLCLTQNFTKNTY